MHHVRLEASVLARHFSTHLILSSVHSAAGTHQDQCWGVEKTLQTFYIGVLNQRGGQHLNNVLMLIHHRVRWLIGRPLPWQPHFLLRVWEYFFYSLSVFIESKNGPLLKKKTSLNSGPAFCRASSVFPENTPCGVSFKVSSIFILTCSPFCPRSPMSPLSPFSPCSPFSPSRPWERSRRFAYSRKWRRLKFNVREIFNYVFKMTGCYNLPLLRRCLGLLLLPGNRMTEKPDQAKN